MKLNNLYDLISNGWKYTILLKIKDKSTKRCYTSDFCRGLRKGDENQDFVRFFKNLDLNVDKIYGGSDDAGIVIEIEPIYIHKIGEEE